MVKSALLYPLAAVAEIAGCFAFWAWLRLDRPIWWLLPGIACLLFFAFALSWSPADAAGRAFAAYGGVYIVASIGWLWCVEGVRPDRWDLAGSLLCVAGALLILLAPRSA